MWNIKCYIFLLVFICKKSAFDCLIFKRTNLELYRPVVIGETVAIDCATDLKNVSLQLIKRDRSSKKETILKPDNLLLKLVRQNFTVLISDKSDDGEYVCSAEAHGIKIEKSLIVYIAAKVSGDIPNPVISKPINTVNQGRKIAIKCSTKGTFAKLSWEKETKKVDPKRITNKKPYFRDGTVIVESVLTINDIKLTDVGTYTCLSISRFDKTKKATATAVLNVNGKKLLWRDNYPAVLNAVTARLESSVIISCTMTHPAKRVTFFRAVVGSQPYEIKIRGKKYKLINEQELVIMNVSLLDHGTYICRTEDNALKEKKIQLFINNYGSPVPLVSVSPRSLELDFNAAVNVTCHSFGNNVKVEWLRNIKVGDQNTLEPVPNEKIHAAMHKTKQGPYKKVVTLSFTNVTVKDAGNYLCKVTLDGKPAFSEVDITVRSPLSPQIKRFVPEVTEEDERVELICRNKGAPEPVITFYKGDVLITPKSIGYIIKGRKLVITKPKFPKHDGIYTCKVENMFGTATGKAKLTVTVSPMIDKTKTIVVVGGKQDLNITCNILRSNPTPKITWQFQPWSCPPRKGYDCSPLSYKWKKANPNKYNITPSDTDVTMSSTFKVPKSTVKKFFIRCLAQHKHGKDSHEVIGIIDGRDAVKLLKSLPEKKIVDEEQSFQLTCTGEAGLFLSLTWKKDGILILHNNSTVTIKESGSILETQISTLTITKVSPSQSGFYSCIGKPARLEDNPVESVSEVKINKIYAPKVLSHSSPSVIDGQTAVITCEIDSHPSAKVTWFKDNIFLADVGDLIRSKEDCKDSERGNYFSITEETDQNLGLRTHQLIICRSMWQINNGTYTCFGSNRLGHTKQDNALHVYSSPSMLHRQVDKYALPGEEYSMNCSAEGNPTPYIWWEQEKEGVFYSVSENSTTGLSYLNISTVGDEHYGRYRCVAENKLDVAYDHMVLRKPLVTASKYKEQDSTTATASLITALIAAIFIIVLLSVISVILYKRKQLYGGFYILSIPPSPDYLRKLDPTRSISEQVHKLPYFPEWEFPRNKVRMKTQVGAGAFGEVYIADAVGILGFDPRLKISSKHKPLLTKTRFSISYFSRQRSISRQDSVTSNKSNKSNKSYSKEKSQTGVVAVKKLKEDATTVEYKDLISEMKILIHIGTHGNIVNLLGACTKGAESDTMVILEYCPHGSLLSFMKERRQMFKPIWSKQHHGMEKEFTTFDLCVAAYQIAKGLDYLAARKCVHRDVAARNVLIGENYVMKVADFGLARDVYEDERYVKVSGGLLPIKWMAIESVFDRIFTHQSDVWSYGILLWELMTLGGSPYPGLPTKDLPEFLSSGQRLSQPQFCPNEIYGLMRESWSENPARRPTFADVVLRLARVVEAHCNAEEVNLYLDKCHISGGSFSYDDDDYLKPVDMELGTYHSPPSYSSPPSYLQSFGDPRFDTTKVDDDDVFRGKSSERYVPDNRLSIASVEEKMTIGSSASSDRSIEPKAKLDELVNEKGDKDDVSINIPDVINDEDDVINTETTPLCENTHETKLNKEQTKQVDEDKDVDENSALLSDTSPDEIYRTPSPVIELSNFINQEYENMGNNTYVNT